MNEIPGHTEVALGAHTPLHDGGQVCHTGVVRGLVGSKNRWKTWVGLGWLACVATPAFATLPSSTETCNGEDDDLDGSIDEGACSATGCDVLIDSSGTYLVCDAAFVDRADADAFCDSWGYHLADVGSEAEHQTLVSLLDPSLSYWHGVNDLALEGDYVQSDGSALSYTNWDANQPDGLTSENCATFYHQAATPFLWHDADCSYALAGAVCEIECSTVQVWDDDDGDGFGEGSPVTICGPPPPGTATQGGDCNDNRSASNPDETEDCNGFDDDCDGEIDELWTDGDSDGVLACLGDCDDGDPTVHPGAAEACNFRDDDCDGVMDDGHDLDGDAFTTCAGDCDDADPDTWPGAAEDLDTEDDDCDGDTADGPSTYQDADGDGFGDPSTLGATGPDVVNAGGDCDDQAALRYPAAPERCNGVDDDCDGQIDEGETCGSNCQPVETPSGWFLRCADSMEYPEAFDTCRAMGWQIATPQDLDEHDDILQTIGSTIDRRWWHGAVDMAEEGVWTAADGGPAHVLFDTGQPNDDDEGQDCLLYDPRPYFVVHDRNCNDSASVVCEACTSRAWFVDLDGDGSGAGEPVFACERPDEGFSADGSDCDDTDPAVWTGAAESCDGVDNDCDGTTDEGPAIAWTDGDGDGHGGVGTLVSVCGPTPVLPGDCDDSESARFPGATEACNGVDDDCDGRVDEDGVCDCEVVQANGYVHSVCTDSRTWASARSACQSDGYDLVVLDTPEEHRQVGIEAYAREDRSFWLGFDRQSSTDWAWVDGTPWTYDRFANDQPSGNGDCGHYWNGGSIPRWNDFPCDIPENFICEAECDAVTVFRDADGDGDGDPTQSRVLCGPAVGWVLGATDCDDSDPLKSGAFSEICDGIDNDCTGMADDALQFETWYADVDMDGFGDLTSGVQSCDQPPGTVTDFQDCNDGDPDISPAAEEVCDGVDNNCDGLVDNATQGGTAGFLDLDGDGFGDDATADSWCPNSVPSAFVQIGGDCNDTDPAISPAEMEVCGGPDENCNGLQDDDDPTVDPTSQTTVWPDLDEDGFGNGQQLSFTTCFPTNLQAPNTDDCDDTSADINPEAVDIPGDGIDQDCDGIDPAVDVDTDGDGLTDIDEIALGSDPEASDTDGDGLFDPDELVQTPDGWTTQDSDGDGTPDHADPDDDGDMIPTADELTTDSDGDGVADYLDTDSDDDGVLDGAEQDADSDGDGVIDRLDPGGDVASAPPVVEPGCGCASARALSGGPVGLLAVFGLVWVRRSRVA